MEQAHGLFLMFRRAGLQNGADEHFNQPAAYGIEGHRNEDPCKGIGQHFRQNGQQHQSCGRHAVGNEDGGAVPNPIHKLGGQKINQQLNGEVDGNQHGDLRQGNLIGGLECDQQQGHKVIHNGLHNVADKAGVHGFLIVRFQALSLP